MALSGSKSLKWHSFDSTMVPFEAFVLQGNANGICSEVINLFKGPIVLISSDVVLWKCKEGSKIIVMMMMIKCYA